MLRRRLVAGAVLHVAAAGTGVDGRLVDDVCGQAGVTPQMFRTLFPDEGAFLDAINDSLVDECVSRLSAAVSRFHPAGVGDDALVEAAVALAEAHPLTRAGMLILASRRLRALEHAAGGRRIAEAERQYAGRLLDTFAELLARLDRHFTWPQLLAVRVILDTYERSFELWVADGGREDAFASSPYVRRTLPRLLGEMSAP